MVPEPGRLAASIYCPVVDRSRPSLTHSRLFDGMPDATRAEVLAAGSRRELRKGDILIRQGEPAAAFFLIDRGYLKLTQVTPEGAEVIVRFVGPWDPVAGVAAVGSMPYPVTATACDTVELLMWPRPRLLDLLERHPTLKTNILREMTAHMDDALTRLRELATLKVSQRLAHTLLRLTGPGRASGDRRLAVPHALTRQELAELTGTTLFTVSRILSEWEAVGLVRSTRAHVEVLDVERLREAADA
jgi:CRP-like cAMP-binding protein